MPFAIPMTWQEPQSHDDYYFYLCKLQGFNAKSKDNIQYPVAPLSFTRQNRQRACIKRDSESERMRSTVELLISHNFNSFVIYFTVTGLVSMNH